MAAPHCPDEVGLAGGHTSSLPTVYLDHAHRQTEDRTHQAHRLEQVGAIGDHHGGVVLAQEPVDQEVGRQIHVGALLLRYPHPRRGRALRGRNNKSLHFGVLHELTEVDAQIRERTQRRQVGVLPLALVRPAARRIQRSGEVAPEHDFAVRERLPTELHEVEPLVRLEPTAAESGVVEVIAPKKQKPPGGGFAPRVERGVSDSIMRGGAFMLARQ